MATVVLIPGAGGPAWYWHRLVPQLRERGNDAVAVGLHAGVDAAGLAQCADTVIEAIGDRRDAAVGLARGQDALPAGRDDRFFPVEMQRRVVRERLGFAPDEMPGGHLVALSRPRELADRLEDYVRQLPASAPDRAPTRSHAGG